MKPAGQPLGLHLALTGRAVARAFNEALADVGGSLPAWLILNALSRGACRAQRDIADTIGLQGPTVTTHIDNLERAGLVTRIRDEDDRRNIHVELTAAGVDSHQRLLQAVIAFNRRLRRGVSGDEAQELARLLTRLRTNLADDGIAPVRGVP